MGTTRGMERHLQAQVWLENRRPRPLQVVKRLPGAEGAGEAAPVRLQVGEVSQGRLARAAAAVRPAHGWRQR